MPSRRSFLIAAGAAGLGSARVARAAAVPRVFAAGPPAAVLVYVLAPEALLGWTGPLAPDAASWMRPGLADLPVLGRLSGRGSTVSLEALVKLAPGLVLDVGSVDPTHASAIERVRQQTGLRCELLDGRIGDSPALLREAGRLLGVEGRAERLEGEARRLLAEVVGARSRVATTRVYLARGQDGLETGLAGSINAELLEFVGARNVAAEAGAGRLARVSLEQVIAWDPEAIVTQDRAFARAVAADPLWKGVAAVREGRVLCPPSVPFGWIDAPPGVNRILGAAWLSHRLRPGSSPSSALAATVRGFYDLFYGVPVTDARLRQLLEPPA